MSLRWPDLDLLRRDGDLIRLSPLSRATAREAMLDALRRLAPELTHLNESGADFAIIEALAACVEVVGFYHDRFLTESKLGSAQLLDDLSKVVALVGYRPRPAVAATAYQFFEAIARGVVDAGTQVAGQIRTPPATVVFESEARIEVSPEQNQMPLSPLIWGSAGARRLVVARRGAVLPTEDFHLGTTAMVADVQGLELSPVDGRTTRGVALERPLSRSFDRSSVLVSRTTVIRNLRGPRALAADLVAFHVSEAPILHLPSVVAPELLTSTLEIFVLRPGDEALDPSEWPLALRYEEVPDFSRSEVTDLHYRTFVDDALHTWIILRSKLGARTLLDAAALERVHARFVPAIGSVLGDGDDGDDASKDAAAYEGPSPVPDLTDVTLGLDGGYFDTSLVLPPVANISLQATATWAMVDRDLGLRVDDSILIQAADGRRWVRTLKPRPAGASPRLLCWTGEATAAAAAGASDFYESISIQDAAPARIELPQAYAPIDGALDPASTRIGSLVDAANGEVFPTWSDFYAQLEPLGPFTEGPFKEGSDLPIVPPDPNDVIERQRVVAAGTTYLVLRDASSISAGDFLLLGARLTELFRALQPFGSWRWKRGEPPFDRRAPWLDAEILQALEVRGNVVRLATPVSQDYFVYRSRVGSILLSEVIAVPGVVSAASGDRLRQTLILSTQPVYADKDEQLLDATYVRATLESGYKAGALRRPLLPEQPPVRPDVLVALPAPAAHPDLQALPPGPSSAPVLWDRLFVAVAGVAEAQAAVDWTFDVVVRTGNLRAPADQILRLEDDTGALITAGPLAAERPLRLVSPGAAARVAEDGSAIAVLAAPPVWRRITGREPVAGEFRVDAASFILEPPELASEALLRGGGTLVITPPQPAGAAELVYPVTWDQVARAPRVQASAPAITGPFEALLVSATQRADLLDSRAAEATVDWRVSGSCFASSAFDPPGRLVAAAADGKIVLDRPFSRGGGGLEIEGVPVTSIVAPLREAATVWAVLPEDVRITSARARWVYELSPDDQDLPPPSANVRLALVGARREYVRSAQTGADGRTVVIEADADVRTGDLGFPLDMLCILNGEPVAGSQITESEIWAWQGIDPPLADLPEARDSRFIAVLPASDGRGLATAAWSREDAWWDPERRTLRLPSTPEGAPPDARPSDLLRLIQVLAPAIDRRRFAVHYDPATDRSILTMELPPGWPGQELAPAPVVVAALRGGRDEIRDMIASVDVFTGPEGRVRWSMHFAGDLRDRWRHISVALRDWQAPAERGLAVAPLWRVKAPAAWLERHRTGPVTLIARLRGQSGFQVLAAMPRPDGDVLALAPLGRDDELPAAASVEHLDLATYVKAAAPGATLELRGTTVLELPATGGSPPAIEYVAFKDRPWRPIGARRLPDSSSGGQRYELDRAYLSVFPDGIPGELRVRLCYATSELEGAIAAEPRRLRFRLLDLIADPPPGAAANAAVLHSGGNFTARTVLDIPSTPRLDAGALVVEIPLGAGDLAKVFGDNGTPRWRWLDLAQRLRDKVLKALPLRVELGGKVPYSIEEQDVLRLHFPGSDAAVLASVQRVGDGGVLDLNTSWTLPPDKLALYGLRTPIAVADYTATLELTPSSSQPPWLMSFSNDPSPSSLLDTLLPYKAVGPGAEAKADGPQRLQFSFEDDPKLADIFRNAGKETLYLFTNERAELRGDFYTGSDDGVAKDPALKTPQNFLEAPEDTVIDQLVLTSSAWAGKDLGKPRPVLLCSTTWTPPADGPPWMQPEDFPELRIDSVARGRVPTNRVHQSARFTSGNFIPVTGQGTTPANAAALIASALRVAAQPVDRDGSPMPKIGWKSVRYVSLEELGNRALAGDTKSQYVFSASFSPTGVCTLHFLFIDDALIETVNVRIEAQYGVTYGRADAGRSSLIYPLETTVAPFEPAKRLALVAPGQLKPGMLLFVRPPRSVTVPALQWTEVTSVTGPIVEVSPPIAYEPTGEPSSFEPIEVTALGKLARAAQLDADYYATVAKAELVPSPGRGGGAPPTLAMPLRDRLPLDVVARPKGSDASLLTSLVPGDPVLVFDERWRQAWGKHRGGTSGAPASTADWWRWPDFQHQAVVKRVDPETGLLILGAPLPDAFQIRWELDEVNRRLTPNHDDVAALRVLPHYRTPVQGPRTLTVLGSGDSTRRFARFVSSLDARTGSAVIPLGREGVTAGNLEVLSFDPEKATWTRWLRHDKLSRAGKKDPAFLLGFRPTGGVEQVPISVTFGDGLTGQLLPTGTGNVYLRATRIGKASRWLPRRRRVRIVSREVAAANLRLEIECAAPRELIGDSDLGRARWRPALELVVTMPDNTTRELREISEDEAAGGAHGFLFTSRPNMPPGVVEVTLFAQESLEQAPVEAWQIPGSRQWELDQKFYDEMPDLTAGPGADAIQLLSTAGLRPGSLLALVPDQDSPPQIVRLASIDPPTWSAKLEAPLARAYDIERSFIRGNVARIVQGTVERTTIGSSDGTTRWLRLPLQNRAPLLYRPGADPEPDVRVFVARQPWRRVLDFAGATASSRVWRLDVDPDGLHAFVVFGDGKQGAIPPAGRDHIEAIVRMGNGAAGNLPAGAIDKLVSGNLAVRSTANLTPAAGGSAGDTPAEAREKAYARRLPSERVVSAADCARAALGVSGVISAALDPTPAAGTLRLVVAMEDRHKPNVEELAAVRDQVAGAMPATARVRLVVEPAEQRAVHLVVEIGVAGGLAGEVFARVASAFGPGPGGFFAAARWDIGEPLRLGDIYDALFQVDGVAHARVLWMADTPLLEGAPEPGPAPDVFDPGATGVVRCDNNPVADPFGRLGTFRIQQAREANT